MSRFLGPETLFHFQDGIFPATWTEDEAAWASPAWTSRGHALNPDKLREAAGQPHKLGTGSNHQDGLNIQIPD